ncbi:Small, acid-soluble spore protein, alpha/beta type [compost metagenome]
MGRRKNRQYAYPVSPSAINTFKADVMRQEGYTVNSQEPDQVKFEVAQSMGIPLSQGDNGQLKTEDAGRIGGKIGGAMVKEMIRMAQQHLAEKQRIR